MKKIVHKNQVVITTLALLLAIVGYISYDAKTSSQKKDTVAEIEKENQDFALAEDTEEPLNPGETILTSTIVDYADYASEVKLNREQIRSKNKESLLQIINDESIDDAQKKDAIQTMISITEIAEKEADAEMLLKAKGFSNVVVSVSDESCDVVLDMGDVTDAKRAQVEDIVKRKTGIAADKIVITTLSNSGARSSEKSEGETKDVAGEAAAEEAEETSKEILDKNAEEASTELDLQSEEILIAE